MVGVADRADEIVVIPADHNLVRIANQHLQHQFYENWPGQAQDVVLTL